MRNKTLWRRATRGALLAAALLALAAAVLALDSCRARRAPTHGPDAGSLTLEKPYDAQALSPAGTAEYHFYAPYRGVYLIVVAGNRTPVDITIDQPKRICHLVGNGSCELVSGPDENYAFKISANAGAPGLQAVRFTLLVTHSDGRFEYEGQVGQPVALRLGRAHQGSVGVYESSYYSFVPGRSGPYTIAVRGGQSDLLWRLFDAPDYDVILQECNTQVGAGDEVCETFPLHAGVRYYLKVEERSGVPGTFKLDLGSA